MTSRKTRLVAAAFATQSVIGPLTLRDLSKRSDDQIRGPRLLWRVWGGTNILGAVSYWVIGRKRA